MEIVGSIKHDRQHPIGVGEGMNSEVFKAFDPQLGGHFAVKMIEKSKFGGDLTQYFQEAKAMYANAHRNVVPIQYACEDPTHIMLAMPYYKRGSLAARIASGPVSATEFIRIAVGVLHGVAQIHNKGYVHFDLKPSNVFFDDLDTPMVADFGQTRRLLIGGSAAIPRMYYRAMPPETFTSGAGTPLGDIYQLGVLFYRIINGDPLYELQFAGIDLLGIQRLVISGKLPNRNLFLPHVPKRIRSLIRKALKVTPTDRYASADEFSRAIARSPVGLDWSTRIDPSGEIHWRAARPGRADLEIDLLRDRSFWTVNARTLNGTSRRAFGGTALNRSGFDWASAMAHLNAVFADLA